MGIPGKPHPIAAPCRHLLLAVGIAAIIALGIPRLHSGARIGVAVSSTLATTTGSTGVTPRALPRALGDCACSLPRVARLNAGTSAPAADTDPSSSLNPDPRSERFSGEAAGRPERAIVTDPTDGRAYLLETANLLRVRGWIAVKDDARSNQHPTPGT